jgi:hypothetical protein
LRVTSLSFIPPSKPQDTPHLPLRSKEWATKQAEKFCSLLYPSQIHQMRATSTEFVQHTNHRYEPNIYLSGCWNITFCRYVHEYLVVDDRISVRIDEKFGLIGYANDCKVVVDERGLSQSEVSEDSAKLAAIRFAQKLMDDSPATRAYYGGHTLNASPLDTRLVVARANDLLTCQKIDLLKRGRKGVLVWAVQFRLDDASFEGKVAPGTLIVYIDAITGEPLGGVF